MAVKPPVKAKKRRPAPKKRPPLKSAKQTTVKPKKTAVKTKPAVKARKTLARPRQKHLINLPLGRGTRLVLSVSTTKPKPAKKKAVRKSAKKTARTKKQELLVSAALLLSGLSGSVFFGMHAIASPSLAPVAPVSGPAIVKAPAPVFLSRSVPVGLRIPSIQVNTSLSAVGLKPDGSLQVPAQYETAGWYDHSPTPGELGPSVITGHLDNVHGIAVFWRLRELVPGDTIEIDRQDGTTARFKVLKISEFSQNEFPSSDVYGNIKYAGLRLITCGGTFNRLSGHYDQNIVVFAALTS